MAKISHLLNSTQGMAAFCAVLAVFFFSVNDASIKFLSGDYALHQIILFRSLIGLLVLLTIFIPFRGTFSVLKTRRLGMHILRGFAVVFANLTFFLGLAELPLAEATAIFFCQSFANHRVLYFFLERKLGFRDGGQWFLDLLAF